MKININNPTPDEIQKYLNLWDDLENYVLQEKSLEKLFTKTYPKNDAIEDILIKVCSLNDFYSTNILKPFNVAKHILNLDIDKYLDDNDKSIVNKIALVNVGHKEINFYSFATKYCSHHKPTVYPIFDYYVEKMLCYFRDKDKFTLFNNENLKNYENFIDILNKFKEYYKLKNYNLKDIDKYLWQAGKEYFPRKYK